MHVRHTESPSRERDDWRSIRALLPFLWDYRGRAGLALGLLVMAKLANVGVPLALKGIVDQLDAANDAISLPIALLVGYGVLRLASSLFNELRDVVFARVRHGTLRRLSVQVLEHLHRLSLRFHLERRTGAVSRDLERGTRSASTLLNYMVFNIFPIFTEVLLIAGILLTNYSAHFALVTLATVIAYVLFTVKITEWRMQFRQSMNRLDSQANSQAIDSLINYETVKYFGNEALEREQYNRTLNQWEEAAVLSQSSMSGLNVGQGAIIACGVTAIMVMAAQQVVEGSMSLGDLVLVNAFMLQLFIPLNTLGIAYSQLKHALSDMDRMYHLLETEPEIRDADNAKPLHVEAGEVRFRHTDFHYSAERPILNNIDFTIPAGKKLAVVGHSGAGKSTLARLLYRFYDVTGGGIEIDGQDLRSVTQQSLRAAIAIVPQDTVLFNDSLYYNILYARPDASRKEIEQAARMADIHHFITTLPQGYDTLVGERGLKLSGGEKQRVAIARAILKRPRLLIFDEATSSLDSRSEQAILESLRSMASHHTTLVIAHRLSTVIDADEILVMEQGHIIERGSHLELLARAGHYAAMWWLQQEQEAIEGEPASP